MRRRRARQRGVAILTAMLTVALVATFAAAALWQQSRGAETEAADHAWVRSDWALTGAVDWAREILHEDARSTPGVDHLGEPWSAFVRQARLDGMLGAGDAGSGHHLLTGAIADQQALLNINNLVEPGEASAAQLRSFQRLFVLLGLPQPQLDTLVANLRRATDATLDSEAAARIPLAPTRAAQLERLGLPQATLAALLPHVTLLPERTRININTASAEVLHAAIDGLTLVQARQLVHERRRAPFNALNEAAAWLPQHLHPALEQAAGVGTRYFLVVHQVRMDGWTVEERALVQRDGLTVQTLWRQRSVPQDRANAAPAQR